LLTTLLFSSLIMLDSRIVAVSLPTLGASFTDIVDRHYRRLQKRQRNFATSCMFSF
jgi:hypothetical protein